MTQSGTIYQLSVSNGGVPKRPVTEAHVFLGGMEGDTQADRRHHGGPGQDLCLYSLEVIRELQSEGHPIGPGNAGENVTIEGIDWSRVLPGTRLRLGDDVLIEISDYATPCWKNANWFSDGDFNRMNQRVQSGCSRVYASVLQEGLLRVDDSVTALDERAAERVARTQPPSIRWRPPQ